MTNKEFIIKQIEKIKIETREENDNYDTLINNIEYIENFILKNF